MPLLAVGIAVLLFAPGLARAQTATQPGASSTTSNTSTATASSATTATYDLSFTLPTAGKSGCMVCHGDPNLVRIQAGKAVSMWIDSAVLANSVHANIQCTGCHLDFAYSAPHAQSGNDAWRDVAKAACKNCHEDAFAAYSKGVHSPAPTPAGTKAVATSSGVTRLPLCGDCHGSHDIQKLKDNPAGQEALHARGKQVCGECHQDYWDNYDDYYHGAAYKRGAPDAPACWQCHGAHDILPSSDRASAVNPDNLVETCGQCHHNDPNETYTSYSQFIHTRSEQVAANPLMAFWRRVIRVVRSWFS
jgi:5-methylcytosine-specific restriction endonuclease McrA